MKNLILLVCLLAAQTSVADYCKNVHFTDPSQVTMRKESVVIATHPSTLWDGYFSSKAGMDSAVAFGKRNNYPVIYLQDDSSESKPTYFYSDCNPDYWIASSGGEFAFQVTASHVYTVGGHFEACQWTTMAQLMNGTWQPLQQNKDVTLTEVMDGIYSDGSYVKASDSYNKELESFFEILSYNNPRDKIPLQHLNILQTMGIIKSHALQVAFLKRSLNWLGGLTTNHKVDLYMNGEFVETLRPGRGRSPPLFKLEFKNSLYKESGGDTIPAKK